MIIQEKELKVYGRTNSIAKVHAMKISDGKDAKWQLEFQFKGEKERALFVTSLNQPRLFKSVNTLVDLLQEWCPFVEYISLGIRSDDDIKRN
jgi:hypothetical protein